MIQNSQICGALLQVKDLFEVLLKLPVIIAAVTLLDRDRNQTENRILLALLEKLLSLGDWEAIARQVYNQLEFPTGTESIEENLKAVLDLFAKNNIVKWRNEVIGHGALSLNEFDDVGQDLAKLLKVLKSFFSDQDGFYRNLELRVPSLPPENVGLVLKGKAKARLLEQVSGERDGSGEKIRLSVDLDGYRRDLFPFAFISAGNVFFFQ